MAVYFQPQHTPYWQQAAINLIGGLITDAIQKGRETTQNRKMNALMAQSMQDAQGGKNLNVDFTGGLASVPEGYNNNGWQQSFHKTGSPIEQFNMGTNQITQPKQNFIPSAWDIRQAILNNARTDRFSSINPKLIEEIANPYYQNAEQMRIEGLRNQAADELMKLQDSTDIRNFIYSNIVRGLMPESLGNNAQRDYEHDNPLLMPVTVDYGGGIRMFNFNPASTSGQYTPTGEITKTMSPSDYIDSANKTKSLEIEQQKTDNLNDYYKSIIGYRQGQNQADLLETQRKALQDEYKLRAARLEAIQQELIMLGDKGNEVQRATLLKEANEIQRRITEIGQLYNSLNTSFMPQPTAQSNADTDYDNLGSMFLGGNSVITSPFGSRVLNGQQKNHDGQDNRAKEGTPLKVPSALGDDFRVTRVYSGAKNGDPKGGNGYGNYIELEGTIKGTPVRFLFAHLQPGSVNLNVNDTVKAGQVFAKTGNTGRSTAPHLHTEVMIKNEKGKWKNVDPDKFFKQYKGNFGATSAIAPNTGLADIKPDSNDVKNTPKVIPDNAVFARKDGDTLTQEDINELLSKGHTLDEIEQYGYTVTDKAIKKVRDNPVNKRMSRGYPHFIGGL